MIRNKSSINIYILADMGANMGSRNGHISGYKPFPKMIICKGLVNMLSMVPPPKRNQQLKNSIVLRGRGDPSGWYYTSPINLLKSSPYRDPIIPFKGLYEYRHHHAFTLEFHLGFYTGDRRVGREPLASARTS